MSWSYNTALTAPKDIVRYLVSDTDTTEQLVLDEEITFAVGQNPNVRLAAAEIADRIAVKFARQASFHLGDASIDYSRRAQQYIAMAKQLRAEAGLRGAKPYMGGITMVDKDLHRLTADVVRQTFTRTLFDNPGTGVLGDDDLGV